MNFFKFLKFLSIFFLITLTLAGCKKIDWDEEGIASGTDRARKNVEEGKGFRLGGGKEAVDSFASANELWRASIETLNFINLSSLDYAGGIIITDWYSENNSSEAIKITVRFLSNEIRADGIEILLHKKICDTNNNCTINKIDNTLSFEIKDTILRKAALLKKENETKRKKDRKGKVEQTRKKYKQQKIQKKGREG